MYEFRQLFHALIDGNDVPARNKVDRWRDGYPSSVEQMRALAAPVAEVPAMDDESLWGLYGASRVSQVLLLGFQPGTVPGSDYAGPDCSADDYVAIMEGFGCTLADRPGFSPFFHEIVAVEQTPDEDHPIEVLSQAWPCLMLGEMLFERAGVRVRGGRRHVQKGIAEASTLYWTYQRKNRRYADLSHGWGSNSQWRTDFRRDYHLNGRFLFNVDGRTAPKPRDLNDPITVKDEDDLTRSERLELLTHRCFVTCPKPHEELWPYYDFYETAADV